MRWRSSILRHLAPPQYFFLALLAAATGTRIVTPCVGAGCEGLPRKIIGCSAESGILHGHCVLVALCPHVLAEEAPAPGTRGRTRLDFADRIVAASHGLLQRLV